VKSLGTRGHDTLLCDDGALPDEHGARRHLWRALRGDGTLHHLVEAWGDLDPSVVVALLPQAALSRIADRWVVTLPFSPGLFLLDLLAQGEVEGGEVPVEAAVAIVVAVARAVGRVHRAGRFLSGHLAEHVRVGFDGEVALWRFGADDDAGWDNKIMVLPPIDELRRRHGRGDNDNDDDDDDDLDRITVLPHRFGRRRAPAEEAASPEEAEGGGGDARSDVFVLGGLLWLTLTGRHPFVRDDLLSGLDALRAAALPPMTRELPPPLLRLLRQTLARDPEVRPQRAFAFADALALFVDPDEGRAAVASLARGLFPATCQADQAFVDEVAVADPHSLRPPTVEPAATVWVPDRPLRASTTLLTNAEVVAWSRRTGRPLPPGFPGEDPLLATRPATLLPPDVAAAVAAFFGGRLPREDEWRDLARGGGKDVASSCGVGALCVCWEWTATPAPRRPGFIVRGGPWRNREERALVDNRSWEDEAAVDVGVRVVFDDEGTRPDLRVPPHG
jgi:hypothetical protein